MDGKTRSKPRAFKFSIPHMKSPTEQIKQLLQRHKLGAGPTFDQFTRFKVEKCLSSGWVSASGSQVDMFEEISARRAGYKYSIATNSGTSAILAMLLRIRDDWPNGVVLVPEFGYAAVALAAKTLGFDVDVVDICDETLCVGPEQLVEYIDTCCELKNGHLVQKNSGSPVICLFLIHNFGIVPNQGALMQICADFEIELLIDGAESFGVLNSSVCGGCDSMTSFNGNKIVTTGGGGAIFTNSIERKNRYKQLTTSGKNFAFSNQLVHDSFGINLRMPALNAALGFYGVENIGSLVEERQQFYDELKTYLQNSDIPSLRLLIDQTKIRSWNIWAVPLVDDSKDGECIYNILRKEHIPVRLGWQRVSDAIGLKPNVEITNAARFSKEIAVMMI